MDECRELIEALERSRDAQGRVRPRAEVKRKTAEYALAQLQCGEPLGRLAAQLGVGPMTLRKWLERYAEPAAALVPVHMTREAQAADARRTHAPSARCPSSAAPASPNPLAPTVPSGTSLAPTSTPPPRRCLQRDWPNGYDASSLVVHAASGLRIEGMTVAQVAELLQRLS